MKLLRCIIPFLLLAGLASIGSAQDVRVDNANNKQLNWRGTSSDTLSNNPEHNEKALDKAVGKMLKNFPPKK